MFENKIVNEETDISKAAVRGNHSSNTFMTQNLKALKQNSLNCITYFKKKSSAITCLLQVTLN